MSAIFQKKPVHQPVVRLLLALLITAAGPLRADDDEYFRPVTPSPKYVQECGACHMAFAPGLLPAAAWQNMMQGLDKHYGVNASLEAADIREIGRWLQVNARNDGRTQTPPPENRITRSAWFVHEHRKIGNAVWQRKSVGSRSNCVACHSGADRGNFDEDYIRIPR